MEPEEVERVLTTGQCVATVGRRSRSTLVVRFSLVTMSQRVNGDDID
jgi:hypothetical protein